MTWGLIVKTSAVVLVGAIVLIAQFRLSGTLN
jgi:hypothetical protein